MSRRYSRAYPHIGIQLYDPDIFIQDEKHDGKMMIGEAQIIYMLTRTQSMFTYKNLPETIPSRNLEMMLQINGNVFFTKVDGEYYVFTGGLGGEPDVYYEPTIYTVANPALNFSKNLKIGEDGILIRSDAFGLGLLPMMQKYAALIVENEFTMRVADICSRISFILSASDDRTASSAKKFLKDIEDGKLGTISDNSFLEDFAVNSVGDKNSQRMTDLVEYQQYLKAAWFNDLGLNANYNMKREAISPDEAQLNDDALLPLIDDMLEERKRGLKQVNEMYGLDIEVDLDSSWMKEQKEVLGSDTSPLMDDSDTGEPDGSVATPSEDPEPEEDPNDVEIEEENTDPEDETEETEDGPEESEEGPEESEEGPEETEEGPEDSEDLEEIKDDIQDIKEDIQDIKEELTNEET